MSVSTAMRATVLGKSAMLLCNLTILFGIRDEPLSSKCDRDNLGTLGTCPLLLVLADSV